MEKVLISFSGGRTSAYMTYLMLKNWSSKYEMIVVFANTGKEREETLEFIDRCDKIFQFNTVWIESITNHNNGVGVSAKVVSFYTASRNGEPFEAMIQKHGIPNSATPHCTRELKKAAIRSYAKSIGWTKYFTAIGIRADEPARLNWTTAKKERLIYPMATDFRSTKNDVLSFWEKQSFDLRLKSYEGNCDFCWKKSVRKLMTLSKENPLIHQWWADMEDKYGGFIPESKRHNEKIKTPIHFFRGNTSAADIHEDSFSVYFDPAVDDSVTKKSLQMRLWDSDLDSNFGCTESCEVF